MTRQHKPSWQAFFSHCVDSIDTKLAKIKFLELMRSAFSRKCSIHQIQSERPMLALLQQFLPGSQHLKSIISGNSPFFYFFQYPVNYLIQSRNKAFISKTQTVCELPAPLPYVFQDFIYCLMDHEHWSDFFFHYFIHGRILLEVCTFRPF